MSMQLFRAGPMIWHGREPDWLTHMTTEDKLHAAVNHVTRLVARLHEEEVCAIGNSPLLAYTYKYLVLPAYIYIQVYRYIRSDIYIQAYRYILIPSSLSMHTSVQVHFHPLIHTNMQIHSYTRP